MERSDCLQLTDARSGMNSHGIPGLGVPVAVSDTQSWWDVDQAGLRSRTDEAGFVDIAIGWATSSASVDTAHEFIGPHIRESQSQSANESVGIPRSIPWAD